VNERQAQKHVRAIEPALEPGEQVQHVVRVHTGHARLHGFLQPGMRHGQATDSNPQMPRTKGYGRTYVVAATQRRLLVFTTRIVLMGESVMLPPAAETPLGQVRLRREGGKLHLTPTQMFLGGKIDRGDDERVDALVRYASG
jgi:hypothetical protein